MAHDLNITNGKASMAFVGQTPWHGLGQKLSEHASIETWTKEAGMDFEILTADVLFKAQGKTHDFGRRQVLYRSDDLSPLSIMSDRYKVVQPADVIEFYRDLTEAAGFTLETAGVLRNGAKYWALAKTGGSFKVGRRDLVDQYLLLATACDGTLATSAAFTSVRVVCQNTLNMAVGADGQRAQIKVPHSTEFNPEKVKSELGISKEVLATFRDQVNQLSRVKVTDEEALGFIKDVFNREEEDQDSPKVKAVYDAYLTAPGQDLDSANHTLWGVVNGFTYYFDHSRKTRTDDSRLNRSWFKDGVRIKAKAFEEALKLA